MSAFIMELKPLYRKEGLEQRIHSGGDSLLK